MACDIATFPLQPALICCAQLWAQATATMRYMGFRHFGRITVTSAHQDLAWTMYKKKRFEMVCNTNGESRVETWEFADTDRYWTQAGFASPNETVISESAGWAALQKGFAGISSDIILSPQHRRITGGTGPPSLLQYTIDETHEEPIELQELLDVFNPALAEMIAPDMIYQTFVRSQTFFIDSGSNLIASGETNSQAAPGTPAGIDIASASTASQQIRNNGFYEWTPAHATFVPTIKRTNVIVPAIVLSAMRRPEQIPINIELLCQTHPAPVEVVLAPHRDVEVEDLPWSGGPTGTGESWRWFVTLIPPEPNPTGLAPSCSV